MDINTLWDELKMLSTLQVFAGDLLCGAVCTNCFEKYTDFFANIKDDSRNAPKRLRKTVIMFVCFLFYFTVFNREKMHFYCMHLLHVVIWKVSDPKAIGYRITAWRITVTSAFWKCVLMIIKGQHDMIRFLLSTFSLLSSSRTAVHILGGFVVSTMSLQIWISAFKEPENSLCCVLIRFPHYLFGCTHPHNFFPTEHERRYFEKCLSPDFHCVDSWNILKNIFFLCSAEEIMSFRFGTTWKKVNSRNYIFGSPSL